jgi:hypothetical protein
LALKKPASPMRNSKPRVRSVSASAPPSAAPTIAHPMQQ